MQAVCWDTLHRAAVMQHYMQLWELCVGIQLHEAAGMRMRMRLRLQLPVVETGTAFSKFDVICNEICKDDFGSF